MRLVSATIIGLISGFLVYMIPAMLVEASVISKPFVIITFGGGTAVTLYILLRGAHTTAEVWARGSLVWAMEWLMASIVPLYISWLAFMESGVLTWGTPQEKTRAESEADIAALTGAAVCLVMAFISYSLYVIAKRCRKSA